MVMSDLILGHTFSLQNLELKQYPASKGDGEFEVAEVSTVPFRRFGACPKLVIKFSTQTSLNSDKNVQFCLTCWYL